MSASMILPGYSRGQSTAVSSLGMVQDSLSRLLERYNDFVNPLRRSDFAAGARDSRPAAAPSRPARCKPAAAYRSRGSLTGAPPPRALLSAASMISKVMMASSRSTIVLLPAWMHSTK